MGHGVKTIICHGGGAMGTAQADAGVLTCTSLWFCCRGLCSCMTSENNVVVFLRELLLSDIVVHHADVCILSISLEKRR